MVTHEQAGTHRWVGTRAQSGGDLSTVSRREVWHRNSLPKPVVAARTEYNVGRGALDPGSIVSMWRAIIRQPFDKGALPDLTKDDLERLQKISGHSTRVGVNQDLFASGEDLAGIIDALRWKSPRMPLAYNRNLAAELLMKKLG